MPVPVHRLAILLATFALAGGCSSFFQAADEGAAFSYNLKEPPADTPADDIRYALDAENDPESLLDAPVDSAIAPELTEQVRAARAKLDTPVTQAAAPIDKNDLWQRLRQGFALDHHTDNPRVQAQLDWYIKHPSYIQRVVERGRRYLYYILSETEKRNLPTEFALLPVVESAFDPFAYSHGRAAGLWQFIPETAKHFGLTQSWWHDDRRDIIAGTNAALEYLDRLSRQFDGDYTLALASYNSGSGTVSRAIARNRKAGKPTDFWSLKLPRETRDYVPKLIALARIFDQPETYGITLPPLKNRPYFEVVETGSQLDLAQAADLAQVDIDEIYLLNPSYNRWATHPDGPHRLLVPAEKADTFRAALARFPVEKRVSWKHYKVRSGDTLITIARKFQTTPGVIRQVNNLGSDLIRIGQQLLIPSAARNADVYALSASKRLERKQEQVRSGHRIRYTVKRGDTFWDIARDHRVSVRELAAWNGMAPGDPLIPGKELVIWSKAANASLLASTSQRNRSMVRKVGYRVRKGDSLYAIANRFSVNVSDIAAWNGLNTSHYLQPGQSLVLYVDIRNSP